jgi:hypothetical protein
LVYTRVQEDQDVSQKIRDEVKTRAGRRIRELENAMQALEEKAKSQD